MKTLKKTLCLVLAVVMVVGVLILPASAVDATAKVEYNEEAVELLQGMKILQGKSDGVLDLDSNVTRAEAATFMARLDATPAFMEKFSNKSIPFADCEDVDWAKTYIAYCYAQGILSGTSTTTFEPTRNVTGHEMAKMLLVAMGYKADKEGFTGDTFQTNVEILAFKTGINDGIDDLSKPLTRGQVVTMIYNTLTKDMVKYDADGNVETQEGKTIYSETFGGEKYTGIIKTNQATGNTVTDVLTTKKSASGVYSFAAADHKTFEEKTGLELLGHVVTVYFSGKTVYTIADESSEVNVAAELTTADAVKAAFGADTVVTANNYTYDNYAPAWGASAVEAAKAPVGKYVVYDGQVVAYFKPTTYTLDKITAIDATAGTVTLYNGNSAVVLSNNATTDVVDEYEGMAKDDYVVYYKTGDIYHLSKAKTVTATPTQISTATSVVTYGGEAHAKLGENKSDLSVVDASAMQFGTNYDFYVDPNGNYIVATAVKGETPAPTADVYVYVVKAYDIVVPAVPGTVNQYGQVIGGTEERTDHYVQAVDVNGKEVIYQTKEALTGKEGKLAKVTTSTDADLKVEVATFDDAAAAIKTDVDVDSTGAHPSTAIKIHDNYYYSSVKFIYVSGELKDLSIVVKDGNQGIPSSLVNKVQYVISQVGETANYTVSVVFIGNEVPAAPVVSTDIVYAAEAAASTTKVPYTDKDGETKTGYVHTVFFNGVKDDTVITATADALTGFLKYTKDGQAYVFEAADAADNIKSTPAKITNMYNGLLSTDDPVVTDLPVAGATVINVSDNTKVPTDPTALSTDDTVVLVLSADLKSIVTIYVTASARA